MKAAADVQRARSARLDAIQRRGRLAEPHKGAEIASRVGCRFYPCRSQCAVAIPSRVIKPGTQAAKPCRQPGVLPFSSALLSSGFMRPLRRSTAYALGLGCGVAFPPRTPYRHKQRRQGLGLMFLASSACLVLGDSQLRVLLTLASAGLGGFFIEFKIRPQRRQARGRILNSWLVTPSPESLKLILSREISCAIWLSSRSIFGGFCKTLCLAPQK